MDPFIGQIIQFAGNFAPIGWAFCDGQLLPISQYSALFSILGTTYGGDGRTTFALPDLRSRVPMHPGRGPGLSEYRLGQKGGQEKVTLNITEIPSHNHNVSSARIQGDVTVGITNNTANIEQAENSLLSKTSGNIVYNSFKDDISGKLAGVSHDLNLTGQVSNTGGNLSHENRQPYTCINFIIALQGIFPSRS